MTREIIIRSFFRYPVDLAAELRDWREFVAGEGYSVELFDGKTGEKVSVRHVWGWEDEHLIITSTAPGELFDRVVGRVVRALSMQSGYLKVQRNPYDEELLLTPKYLSR